MSWNWDWAKELYDDSRRLRFPFMAGSSLPVTWRTPSLEMPADAKVTEAMCAGYGLFGIEIAKQNPQARVTALDWAPVLRVALDNARKAGVHDRYDMLPGSAFEVDFGEPYDAVLLTNFPHHFDQAICVGLLKKVHAAPRPNGRAATLEFVPMKIASLRPPPRPSA